MYGYGTGVVGVAKKSLISSTYQDKKQSVVDLVHSEFSLHNLEVSPVQSFCVQTGSPLTKVSNNLLK